ncbi:YhgE/Pip domain-containing protein [Gordonia sp. SL306]|uniref:YhgE/Pip domain-containing protein n=1 Tax=Gordonia sp. SL306 TaxID=2995145 RepID=UPI00226EE2DA|nr:DUF3533 domain-containing protein [Gordonia sp. SL306]WAC55978.1 DUF3533 domain-containing protein [Gordonia sp. SL306]
MGRHETGDEVEPNGPGGRESPGYSGAEHAAPEQDAAAGTTIAGVLRSPRFWLAPLLLVVVIMSFMAALYMGAVADPQRNLHDFPIALVNEDRGGDVDNPDGGTTKQNFGDQVAAGVISTAAESGIAVEKVDRTTALNRLNSGKAYGVVVIGPNFTNRAVSLGRAAVLEAKPDPMAIDVFINRGSGTFASAVTTTFADQMSEQVNAQVGERLVDTVRQSLVKADVPFSGAAQLALSNPVDVRIVEPTPLPDGSGNGLSAFYFTLLLILAGFTGAMMVSVVVDGILGQTPIEYGPFYQLRQRLAISRWGTLATKWTIMVLVAVIQSALFIAVCTAVGTSLPNAFALWLFSVLVITAVGVSASSMMAVFGNPGLILNLVFFVILGLPSSGGTVPLEASPRLFAWIAAVEPMHLVYLGTRAILYFDADLDAGLGRSIIQCAIGLLVGVLLGLGGTKLYDRKGWHRFPGGMTLSPRLRRLVGGDGPASITTPSPAHVAAVSGSGSPRPPGTSGPPAASETPDVTQAPEDPGRMS